MRNFSHKGQVAMEFMLTYGWAILVVLAAIGALSYFGILNPSRFTPDTCMGTTGVSCAGKPVVNNDSIWFTMVNGLGYTINPIGYEYSATLIEAGCIDPVYCPLGNTTCDTDGIPLSSIPDGGSATVIIPNCNFQFISVIKGDIKIIYKNPQSQLDEYTTISITGKTKQE